MSGAPRLTEVALEKFVDREIEKLSYANILGEFRALPITKGCENILGLDEAARMNRPAKSENNWEWRLLDNQITPHIANTLREMTEIYGRAPKK